MLNQVKEWFRQHLPSVEFAALRYVEKRSEALHMRQNVLSPPFTHSEQGVFIFIINNDGAGYAATSNLSANGIKTAIEQALNWANYTSSHSLFNYTQLPRPQQNLGEGEKRREMARPALICVGHFVVKLRRSEMGRPRES